MTELLSRPARELIPGDRISKDLTPYGAAADILWARTYEQHGNQWTFVVFRDDEGYHESTIYLANKHIILDREADRGQSYSRADEGETAQHIGERVPAHLEDGKTGEVIDARTADLAVDLGLTPAGLTPAADATRGPLAGTVPVVIYCSFGHGQHDPATGQPLFGHYVTVVGSTYEDARKAMFASRFGRAWSFDYLAGRDKTTEWVRRWTEHEVIVAPGTDPEGAEAALKAAREVLDGAES